MKRPVPVSPGEAHASAMPHVPGREPLLLTHDGAPPMVEAPMLEAAMLEARGLCAGYLGRPVLQDVSFTARRGECVALLGPNGSGKTTLLRCLSGVLRAHSGSIFLQGKPLAGLKPRQRAHLAAVVPQGGQFPLELTARQMVLLGRYPHLSWLGNYGRRDHEAVDAALAACEAEALAPRRLAELSGGELQRVLLARALAQESPLLLLDELAAGLDMARMVGLFDLLERRRAAGACVLMAVHDCNLAAVYATRLLGLKAGKLVFDGPVDAVFTEEKLSALYDIPVHVLPHPRWGLPQALLARACGPRSGPTDSCAGAGADADAEASAASCAVGPDHTSGPGPGFCR